ncbi:MAG: glutamate dehydrogenase [Gelidibacter sp.]
MTLILKQLTFISIFIMGISNGFAQKWFSNEIGVIAGPVAFQSDFGERRDFETNAGNTGFGVGLVHFMNFEYRGSRYDPYKYFFDHFKVRSEISWNKTELNHFGKWIAPEKTGEYADKLRAHSGESNNFDIGMQLEYFPFSLKEFSYARNALTPFISFGVHFTAYNPKVFTSYGDGNPNNLDNFYTPWYRYSDGTIRDPEFITSKNGTAFSFVGSVGSRYKLTYLSDLIIDLRWQHYFRDKLDGLNHKLPSNKSNDYLMWLNVGFVYYLE